ncbi:unnamed protein product, partial [Staurois parvus]
MSFQSAPEMLVLHSSNNEKDISFHFTLFLLSCCR